MWALMKQVRHDDNKNAVDDAFLLARGACASRHGINNAAASNDSLHGAGLGAVTDV
jgi:hypothetical protein